MSGDSRPESWTSHGQLMDKTAAPDSGTSGKRLANGRFSGADDEIRTRDPHLGKKIAWRMSHASPPVSGLPLSCTFLALLSLASDRSL